MKLRALSAASIGGKSRRIPQPKGASGGSHVTNSIGWRSTRQEEHDIESQSQVGL